MYINVQAVVNVVSASIISYKYLISIRYLKENKLLLTLLLILERFIFDFLYHYRCLFPIFKQFDWLIG